MPKTRTYEQFEILTSGIKMGVKMYVILTCVFIAVQLAIFLILSYLTWSPEKENMIAYGAAKFISQSFPDYKLRTVDVKGVVRFRPAMDIAINPTDKSNAYKQLKGSFLLYLLCGVVFIGEIFILKALKNRARKKSKNEYVRGARLVSVDELKREMQKRNEKVDLPLGEIQMPANLENRHTLIIGKPGTGKTQCIRPILKRWYALERIGIVYDNKGEYFSEFFDPDTDLLFNPLDDRSLGWNIFNELNSYPDVDAVAASLIPPTISQMDPFWSDAARGVFSGILHHLYQSDKRNNKYLWALLTAEAKDIADKLKNTKGGEAGYRYITQNAKSSRQAESVLAVMMQYTKCFEFMAENEGPFQISKWLNNGKGIIYITNYEDIEETLKPILSLFVDLVGRKLLSMPDDIERRILFGLDEFGSLQRLSTIVKLLTRGRSKGACVFLGIQDDGQTEKIYTHHIRKSIDNACGNRITFALTGETAEKEARYNIGETENIEYHKSMSMGPHTVRDGINISEQNKPKMLIMPSEISNLPDLSAVVRLKNYDFVISKWDWEPAKQNHEPFILRKDLLLENIKSNNETANEGIDLDTPTESPLALNF